MTTTTTAPTTTKKHPIRGFLYGIPFGLGLAMIAIGQKWAALGTWPPVLIFVIGVLASMAWGMFGPAKAPKGDAPSAAPTATVEPDPEPEPESAPDPEPTDDLTEDIEIG
jgi:hypothetical protein